MRAPHEFQLTVSRTLVILFIIVAGSVGHKDHHFVVVCQSQPQARLGLFVESPTFFEQQHEKLPEDLPSSPPIDPSGAGFEFDINGQERAGGTSTGRSIEDKRQTINPEQAWATREHPNIIRAESRVSLKSKGNLLIDPFHSTTNEAFEEEAGKNDSTKWELPIAESSLAINNNDDDDNNNEDDPNQNNIPLLSNEVVEDNSDNHNHQSESSSTGTTGMQRHYGDLALVNSEWCSVNDELDGYCRRLEAQNYSDALRVCGSDGRFHKSICDFKRYSCSSSKDGINHHLFHVRPESYCASTPNSNFNTESSCSPRDYRQFKLALLNEFNEDIELMFKYFDSNHNGLIEARELWPRSKDEPDEPASAATTTRNCDDCYRPTNDEYAFEPHFDWSPCSLSHLLLYENKTSLTGEMFVLTLTGLKNDKSSSSSSSSSSPNDSIETIRQSSSMETARTRIVLGLGESKLIECIPESKQSSLINYDQLDCMWTRYGVNLGTIRDEHIALQQRATDLASERPAQTETKTTTSHRRHGLLRLHLRDAQLYLSGPYKCSCSSRYDHGDDLQQHTNQPQKTFQHHVGVQVLAQPYISIRPKFLWSLPESRIALECHHDFIDTAFDDSFIMGDEEGDDQRKSPFAPAKLNGAQSYDYKLKWSKDGQSWIVDSKEYNQHKQPREPLAECSKRASIMPASDRLVLERVQVNDTGRYYCVVEQFDGSVPPATTTPNVDHQTDPKSPESARIISTGVNYGQLLIQDKPENILDSMVNTGGITTTGEEEAIKYLWSFHENGISVYKLRTDDGQELELVRELTGQSSVSAEVDGNWNQLTLCGGLNPDQVVICEWSDNALVVEVPRMGPGSAATAAADDDDDQDGDDQYQNVDGQAADDDEDPKQFLFARVKHGNSNRVSPPPADKYIYVGQPNLNRVIVMDGQAHEIVAIINTEPQPRKLYSFRPNKIHLSKWVRRRLSPLANARWLKAIDEQQNAKQQQQSRAHPLKLTPKSSRLYSDKRQASENETRSRRHSSAGQAAAAAHASSSWPRGGEHQQRRSITPTPKLVQHDIWLLCYGQPLVVDPSSDLSELVMDLADERAIIQGAAGQERSSSSSSSSSSFYSKRALNASDESQTSVPSSPAPFTPLVAAWPLIGPHWMPVASITSRKSSEASPSSSSSSSPPSTQPYITNKEARLRNRKSVQIIQSTFFPAFGNPTTQQHHHRNHHHNNLNKQQIDSYPSSSSPAASKAVAKFKRLTVLTTHYVIASRGMSSLSDEKQQQRPYLGQELGRVPQFDLVQSLSVPQVPYSQRDNFDFKLHYAYVTHYDERQLYRISMDSYRYDKEINLSDCDPVNLISASQGLLIVQCRSPITHKLVGQLVLDELTSQATQFNANIKAQESCLTPDNRYLISIHTNQSSTIYVQSVKVDGLNLLYEIKTTLETTQCSFVWRDGYYAAIFVALNRRDRQSELLSLRLADSRLELIVRVPGLMSLAMRHKEPLNVEPELQIVSLSTDSGVHIIDLEENRIIQTMDHRHQRTIPTLLWV